MSLTAPAAGAPDPAVGPDDPSGASTAPAIDDLPSPLADKRRDLRAEAVSQVLNGEATPVQRGPSTVVKVGETPEVAETDESQA